MIMQTHTEAPTAALSTVLCWLVRGKDRERTYWRKLCLCGLCMLLTAFFTKRQMYWKT